MLRIPILFCLLILGSALLAQQSSRPIVFKNGQILFAVGKVTEKDGYIIFTDENGNLMKVESHKVDKEETQKFIDTLAGKRKEQTKELSLAEQIELYKKENPNQTHSQDDQVSYRRTGDPRGDTGPSSSGDSFEEFVDKATQYRPAAIPEDTWSDLNQSSERLRQKFDGKLVWALFLWMGVGMLSFLATFVIQIYLIVDAYRHSGSLWGTALLASCIALLTVNLWPLPQAVLGLVSILVWLGKGLLFTIYIITATYDKRVFKTFLYWSPMIYMLMSLVPLFFLLGSSLS